MQKFKNLATLDIGTNSFHLIIAQPINKNNFKIIDRKRDVYRLASGTYNNLPYLTFNDFKNGISLIKKFKKYSVKHNAYLKAVATSAMREAINSQDFLLEVKKQTEIDIEIISGENEAKYIFTAVSNALPQIQNKITLCIDIGGGSTEFIIGKNSKCLIAQSVPLGAVRLAKMFFPDFTISKQAIEDSKRNIKNILKSLSKKYYDIQIDQFVGSSGTIQTTKTITDGKDYIDVFKQGEIKILTKDNVKNVLDFILTKKNLEDRLSIKGLEPKRADVFPAGLIILNEIFNYFQINEMLISDYALREGIIFETLIKMNLD